MHPSVAIYEQIIDRQSAAVEEHSNINDEIDIAGWINRIEEQDEWDDQDHVIREEAQQLTERVVPAWAEQAIQEVKGIAEKDTTEDDGRIGVQLPGENGKMKDQCTAREKERGNEDAEGDFYQPGGGA